MNWVILVLVVLAAASFVVGTLCRFLKFDIRGHESTVWWRGSMGLLAFSVALMVWQIMETIPAS